MAINLKLLEPRYLNDDDIVMRLDGGYLKYKGAPHYAVFGGKGFLQLYNINDVATGKCSAIDGCSTSLVNANDSDLDISAIHIGYVNYQNSVFWVTRPPYRQQKQLTCGSNTVAYEAGSTISNSLKGSSLLSSNATILAILEKYPTFSESYTTIKNGVLKASAFSKRYALVKNKNKIDVYHDQNKIGCVSSETSVKLDKGIVDSVYTMQFSSIGVSVE